MNNMTPDNIATAVGGRLMGRCVAVREADGVVIDSRLVEDNYVFIAIKGNRVDGHDLVESAYESGASLAIVERDGDYSGAYILVDSTPAALRELASYYRRQLTIPIVGIIGSVGKTSTKEMTSQVLQSEYNVLKTKGNLNNDIGLPLTILSIKPEHTIAVVEMGISDFGEMELLGSIARPDFVVYTCIGECHLESLHDRDGVLRAKTEVLEYISEGGSVIINADDDKLVTIDRSRVRPDVGIVTYSGKPRVQGCGAMYRVVDICALGLLGNKITYEDVDSNRYEVTIPVPGVHSISNAMAAIALAHTLGVSSAHIAQGIESALTIAGRSNFIEVGGVTIIDDCYNANPMSMRAGLNTLGMASGRKVAVLGDMGELGDDELALHRELYTSVYDNHIDILLTAGELSRSIVEAVSSASVGVIAKSFVGDDAKDELISELESIIAPGDTILIKASHFMGFDEIVDRLCRDINEQPITFE